MEVLIERRIVKMNLVEQKSIIQKLKYKSSTKEIY